jgi:hypothetical protein
MVSGVDVCGSDAKGPRDNKGVSKRSEDGDDDGDREFIMSQQIKTI